MLVPLDGAYDLRGTLAPLWAGAGDPCRRLARDRTAWATRTPAGPATCSVVVDAPGRLRVEAWGDGAAWVVARAADCVGASDQPSLPDTSRLALGDLARRGLGARFPRTHRLFEALVLLVLQQKVRGTEAARCYRALTRALSSAAPGPVEDLWLPVAPDRLATASPAELVSLGVHGFQARTLVEIGFTASRIEAAGGMPRDEARRRLLAIPGVGAWTASSLSYRAMGDADAFPEGDYHLPSVVAYNLAGEPRGDEARMLALLAPHAGHRGRVVRILQQFGRPAPRRGPRRPMRPFPR